VDAAPELDDEDEAAEEEVDLADGPRPRSRLLLVSSETVAEADVTTMSVGIFYCTWEDTSGEISSFDRSTV